MGWEDRLIDWGNAGSGGLVCGACFAGCRVSRALAEKAEAVHTS